jgi:hypothetical protein
MLSPPLLLDNRPNRSSSKPRCGGLLGDPNWKVETLGPPPDRFRPMRFLPLLTASGHGKGLSFRDAIEATRAGLPDGTRHRSRARKPLIDKTTRSATGLFEPMLDRAIPLLPQGKELDCRFP